MTIDLNTIWQFPLRQGNSKDPASGACLLDAVSWFEYGTLGDHPACVCETLAAPGRIINDCLPDNRRQELKPLIEKMIGTAGDGFAQQRAEFWAWQAIRVFLPMALEGSGGNVLMERAGYFMELAGYFQGFKGTLEEASEAAWRFAATRPISSSPPHETAQWASKAASRASRVLPALTDAGDAAEASATAWVRARPKGWAAHVIGAQGRLLPGALREEAYDTAAIAAMFGACAISGQRKTLPTDKIVKANQSFELARSA